MRKKSAWGEKTLILPPAAVMALALIPLIAEGSDPIDNATRLRDAIADNSTPVVTLAADININDAENNVGLTIARTLTLDLNGHKLNIVLGDFAGNGISIGNDSTLTIKDGGAGSSGELYIKLGKINNGHFGTGAGINTSAGKLIIESGTIIADASENISAAIGGGTDQNGGVVEINGGAVTALARYGAGIGGGRVSVVSYNGGHGGAITINGGTVTATTSSEMGAGIGGIGSYSGSTGGSGAIKITGGTVTAGSNHTAIGRGRSNDAENLSPDINISDYRWWANTENSHPDNPGKLSGAEIYEQDLQHKYVLIAAIPSAPQGFTAAAGPGEGQVVLAWAAPETNWSAVTEYQVTSDGSKWEKALTDTSHIFSGLTGGTEYTFQIRAHTAVLYGAAASKNATPTGNGGNNGDDIHDDDNGNVGCSGGIGIGALIPPAAFWVTRGRKKRRQKSNNLLKFTPE